MPDVNQNPTDVNGTAIHLSLQGKGGVGKSFVASIIAQHLTTRGTESSASIRTR